jgi:hypothetical protein
VHVCDLFSDHRLDHLILSKGISRRRKHVLAVSQDHYAVTEIEYFVEVMGDENDTDSGSDQQLDPSE